MKFEKIKKKTYFTENGEFVVRQESIGLIEEEVSSDELLEAPVFSLHEAIGSLAL